MNNIIQLKIPTKKERSLLFTKAELKYMKILLKEPFQPKAFKLFVEMKKHEQWGENFNWLKEENNNKKSKILNVLKDIFSLTKRILIISLVVHGLRDILERIL